MGQQSVVQKYLPKKIKEMAHSKILATVTSKDVYYVLISGTVCW